MAKQIVYGDSSRQGILRGVNSLANNLGSTATGVDSHATGSRSSNGFAKPDDDCSARRYSTGQSRTAD